VRSSVGIADVYRAHREDQSPTSSGYYNSSNILRAQQLQQNNYYNSKLNYNSMSLNTELKVTEHQSQGHPK